MIEAAVAGLGAAIVAAVSAIYAAKAERNSRPVSNGFANYVKEHLAEIREDYRELRALIIRHLEEHNR
jgi:hypothetical protein